eukprot:6837172-Prymnesium_polylepis.1
MGSRAPMRFPAARHRLERHVLEQRRPSVKPVLKKIELARSCRSPRTHTLYSDTRTNGAAP